MASKLKLTELLYPTSTTPAITINADDTVTFGAPTTTITNLSTTSITDSGNLTFTGTGNRIRGDFSNATIVNRVMFQTSTVNGGTRVSAIANGSGTFSQLALHGGSDPANSSLLQLTQFSNLCSFDSTNAGTGLVSPIAFGIGGSEAMRITTDRNVGIGTISPQAPLNVSYSNAARGDTLRLTNTNTGGYGPWLNFYGDYSSGYSFAKIGAENETTGATLRFHTADTSKVSQERMRIDSSGNLLVGTTSDAQSTVGIKLLSSGRLFATSASDAVFYRQSAGDPVMQFRSDNSSTNRLVATVEATGTYNTISDRSVKKNIENLTETLPQLMQILPVAFNWMSDQDGSDKTIGFVAQDVEIVYPQLITERDGQKMLNTTGFIPFLVKAIQEQQALIQNLTTRLTALEGN
jgi:hypothetical protein